MKQLFLFILLIISIKGLGQTSHGSIDELDFKRGFKTLKLGSDISTLNGKKIETYDTPTGIKNLIDHGYTDSTLYSIGDVKLKAVAFETYNSKIYKIFVFFDKNDGPAVFETLVTAYGVYNTRPNMFMDVYNWVGKKCTLYANYEKKNAVLIFTDKDIDAIIEKIKKEKLGKAASDL